MKFVADENVDKSIVDSLRGSGHDVLYIPEFAKALSDDDVLALARDNNAVLVTTDKDFGELVFRRGLAAYGVVLLRLAGMSTAEKARLTLSAVTAHQEQLAGSFTVITPRAVRIRKQVG